MVNSVLPSEASPTFKRHRRYDVISPARYARSILEDNVLMHEAPFFFVKPTEEEVNAFDLDVVNAIRRRDIDTLRQLHSSGKSLNACNQFGESLLHMACRRGDVAIISFMLREAKVRTDMRDDFGRTIWHDAMWTPSPNFEAVDILIEHADPLQLLCEDVRGNTPFDYARRNHWSEWVDYLSLRKEKLLEKVRQPVDSPVSVN